jgi:hypothetical protein
MTDAVSAGILTLLTESLPAWGLSGTVVRNANGLVVAVGDAQIRITRAPADLPFRWMVTAGGRTRGAIGIPGLLRSVRSAIDPQFRPVRVRIAPLPS